jgi:hypothetical protein
MTPRGSRLQGQPAEAVFLPGSEQCESGGPQLESTAHYSLLCYFATAQDPDRSVEAT